MAKKRKPKSSRSRTTRKSRSARTRGAAKTTKPKRQAPARKVAPRASRPAARPDPVRALAQRIVDLTLAQDDTGSLALYAADVESVEGRNPPLYGIEAIKQKFQMWRGMVSESSWQARNVLVDGNVVIIEWEGHVTLASTGKRVTFHEVAIHEIQNGAIVRERFYYDPSVLQS